jgi:hypothetical protein
MTYCYANNHDWGFRSCRRRRSTDQTTCVRSRLSGLSRKSGKVRVPSHRPWPDTGNIVYEPSAGILWSLPLWGAAGNDRDGRLRSASDVASRRAGNLAIRRGFSSSPRHLAAETLASAIAFSLAALPARSLPSSHQSASLTVARKNARPLNMPVQAERWQMFETVETEHPWLSLNNHRHSFVDSYQDRSVRAWRGHGVG